MEASNIPADAVEQACKVARMKAWDLVRSHVIEQGEREGADKFILEQILRRLGKYDEHRASMRTFIERLARNAVSDFLRHRGRKERDPSKTVSLNALVRSGQDGSAELGEFVSQDDVEACEGYAGLSFVDRFYLGIDARALVEELPAELKPIAQDLLDGYTVTEIALHLAIPRTTVHDRIKQIARFAVEHGYEF